MGEQNQRFTRRTNALFVPGCWRFFVALNPFHARYVREFLITFGVWETLSAYHIQFFFTAIFAYGPPAFENLSNPKPGHTTGRSVWGGARREGGSERRRAAQDADRTVRPGDDRPSYMQDLSNPKPGHTTGGSGRGARRSGRAGSGRIGCQQNYSPRKQRSTVPSKASKI